ncbi:MAG: peptidoglycan DD-metalloendopeptidase family protein [Candidatus Marinimicrobia bacterium]|nr:peptidoglycan DD-metalloendopeptidase family protein [Candidatus Neomarinimicrobiota bacterium]
MIIQILLQTAFPLLLIIGLWRGKPKSRLEWALNTLVTGMFIAFIFLSARWDFISYYLRYFWLIVYLVAVAVSYRALNETASAGEKNKMQIGGNVLLLGVFTWLVLSTLLGFAPDQQAVELQYPLYGQRYYIGGGGASPWLNAHRTDQTAANDFALDIVRLNQFGNRAAGIAPDELSDYTIYGDTVYSPCTGTVLQAVDSLPDLIPPEVDYKNIAGNYLIIEHGDNIVVLAHLKQGSLLTSAGEIVETGDKLAQIGNSGYTSQPHLHIHIEQGETLLQGQGVPFKLNGRFLVRNNLFSEP